MDERDYKRVGSSVWRLSTKGYVVQTRFRGYAKDGRVLNETTYLHREILGLERGDARLGDHKNGVRTDCRRSNLRVVTRKQSPQNRPAQRGYRGVSVLRTPYGTYWRARYGSKHIGLFSSEKEAARAAAEYRLEHAPFSVPGR